MWNLQKCCTKYNMLFKMEPGFITGVLREIQLSSNQEQHIYTAGLFSSMLNEAICVFAILSMTVYFI